MWAETPFLVALFAFIGSSALLYTYRASLGFLLASLALILNVRIPVLGHPFAFLSDAVKRLDSWIQAGLGEVMNGSKWAFTKLLHVHAVLWQDTTELLGDLAGRTQHWIERVAPGFVLGLITGVVLPWSRLTHWAVRQIHDLQRAATHVARIAVHTVTHELPRVYDYITKVTRVVVQSAPYVAVGAGAGTLPRLPTIERDLSHLWKWIRGRTRILSEAGIAAIAVAGILRALPHLNCRNNKALGKHLCSWPTKLFEELLAGVLDVLVFTNVCLLYEAMEKVASTVEPLILGATTDLAKLVQCQHLGGASTVTVLHDGRSPVTAPIAL